MSERVDQFCNNLRERLNAAEGRLDEVKASIGAAKTHTRANIEDKIDEARAAAEAQQSTLEDAQARIRANLGEKKAATVENIVRWKEERHVTKLERRAEFAEDDAVWAILLAADAIDNANLRALDAVVARMDADEATATAEDAADAAATAGAA